MLAWSGFLGGAGNDYGNAIAVDTAGDAYVTGYTSSDSGFPVAGALDPSFNGGYDAFVTKIKGDGSAILASGFIGGAGTEYGHAIAVDGAGNAYVAGETTSAATTFPAAVGPDLAHNGGGDAFVAKVRADFSGLDFAGYVGGSGSDAARGVAVDAGGNVYVTGQTDSTETTFPTTFAPDPTHNGGIDAFVARVDAGGATLDWCGYVGGAATDTAYAIAVTAGGDAVVAGVTGSDESTFPVRGGPDLTRSLTTSDPFVARLTSGNSAPVIAALGDLNMLEGDALEFTVPGSDPDGDTLTFSAAPLPDGATLDPATGDFAWTPGPEQAGTYAGIVFTVSDGALGDTAEITITVVDRNAPPVLAAIGNKSIDEGGTLTFTVSATDGDNDPLTFSAANLPGDAAFDPGTRTFSWTPGFADAGPRTGVRFAVTDGSATDFEEITITVNDVNRPPALDAVGDRTVDEGSALTIVLGADDPDGGPLFFSVANAPAGANFDAGTGTFSWAPAAGQAGTHTGVRFEVSDGTDADFEEITITVADVDQAPVVDGIFPQSVTEGATLSFLVTASDPDNDPLTLSYDALPEGSSFDAATGTFTWRPRLDQSGTYEAVFRATQQTADPLFGTRNVWITVDDPTAPVVAENFTDSTAAGDKDWTRVTGTWIGNGKNLAAAALQANNMVRSALLNPVTFPLGAGVVRARIILAADGASPANASILFAYRSAQSHRWVKVTRSRLSIGQTGAFGGVVAGTKKSAPIALLLNKAYDFRLEIATNGWVRVYRPPATTPALSHRFTAGGIGSVVPGGVGLAAAKARAVFDNVIVEDEAALP